MGLSDLGAASVFDDFLNSCLFSEDFGGVLVAREAGRVEANPGFGEAKDLNAKDDREAID